MWETFIKHYSMSIGFSVRIQHTLWNDDGGIRRREWVCSRQGFRRNKLNIKYCKRRPKNETRCGCIAYFHVLFKVAEGLWRLTKFMPEHNHDLLAQHHLHYLISNRRMSEAQLATIEHGQNIETDSKGLLGYLALKIDTIDPSMYVRYAIDDKDRLCHLFWLDGTSQCDYRCFSDALAFDTTYKTNAFNKTLVIFVGVNNHFETFVFGFGLLQNEKTETYVWVLQTFLKCMNGLPPNVIMTDGDNTMKLAIAQCMLGAVL
ncbi:hypothetical protein UlMin_010803 [Ulmus minor]